MKSTLPTRTRLDAELALVAAQAAGKMLRAEFGRGSKLLFDGGRDIKLAADILAEKAILSRLRNDSPYPVLSEESAAPDDLITTGRYWVVDPLDGTFNFSRGVPLCCVSIALWQADEPVFGVVHDFLAGVSYTGIVGEGAKFEGEPLRVSRVNDRAQAAIAVGFPTHRDYQAPALARFVQAAAAFKKLRLLGSAALSLAYVAAGRLEAYCEEDIWLWDVAAGLALVRAAGGDYEMSPGASRLQRNVFASNGLVGLPEPGPGRAVPLCAQPAVAGDSPTAPRPKQGQGAKASSR